jgi:hypothetical protein
MYEIEEVANLAGLKASSVREYCGFGKTTLVRGRDYAVLRRYSFGRLNRKLVITKRGLDRIIARDFSRLYGIGRKPSPETREIISRLIEEAEAVNPCNPGTYEAGVRQRQLRALRLAYYLVTNPCRQPGCICPCHSPVGGHYQVDPSMNGNRHDMASENQRQ